MVWAIAALATAGVIVRPWRVPEFVWAVAGAVVLVLFGLLPPRLALSGIARGTDVYLFLAGMMLLSATARRTGLFEWLAALAAERARGSAARLFALIYAVGILVTVFLSNDATAVVLTPAVAAVARAAGATQPLPYLLICAFIANAASFVLPISNPANLVIYGGHMPPLAEWVPRFALPSALSIAATYAVLRLTQGRALRAPIAEQIARPRLSAAGKTAGLGIVATAIVLMAASGLDIRLGLPTCVAGTATATVVLLRERAAPWAVLGEVSWGVLVLVAGLFVLVEALSATGVLAALGGVLTTMTQRAPDATAWSAGGVVAIAANLMNNLPAGLIAGRAVQEAGAGHALSGAVLIGIDLGPNLSVTGSLATILWLTALRREGVAVGAWAFLKLGALAMPPALVLALGALLLR